MLPHGRGKYRYALEHRHGWVGVSESSSLPALRVQPRAEFLHGLGPAGAVRWFDGLLAPVCEALRWSVSRLDLFADWQGWNLSGEDRHRFVCRADTLAVHEERRDFTGMEFGRRTTKTLCCRIYDKTVQAEYSGAGYWKDIWADRWSPDLPVMRVEFEFGRAGLRQFGIDGVQEAIEASGALWAYATGTWLTLRASGSDPTRSHWPITGGWETIGRASISSGSYGIERMYEGRRSGTLRRLMPGLVGYLSSFAAIVGAEDVDDTLGEVGQYLMAIERDTMHPFSDRVAAKVRELGWR